MSKAQVALDYSRSQRSSRQLHSQRQLGSHIKPRLSRLDLVDVNKYLQW